MSEWCYIRNYAVVDGFKIKNALQSSFVERGGQYKAGSGEMLSNSLRCGVSVI